MRIISGIYKGFGLHIFPGQEIRPTPSKIREAIFDILAEDIIGADFLDLFAGTGAVGIEAVSRGAKRATFVEKNKNATRLIKENLAKINHHDVHSILKMDYSEALKSLHNHQKKFDIIFLDPPYGKSLVLKALQGIVQNNIAKNNAIILVQHPLNENIEKEYLNNLIFLKEKKYGKSKVSLLKKYEE